MVDNQGLKNIIVDLIREAISGNVVMRTKGYLGGSWDDVLAPIISDLFKDVGVKQIDAKKGENSSYIKILLKNGDSVRGDTIQQPISGTVTINGKYKKALSGREAMMLVGSMRKAWEEYSASGGQGAGAKG